jgi:uncharacterized protein (TIGR02444 family)
MESVSEGEADLWTFSLAVYAAQAVQKECLDLQNDHGVDVNLLLFCAFVGAVHGAVLSDQAMKEATGVVDEWHKAVVRPLRQARRALKPLGDATSPISAPAAQLRAGVKALELDAERIEQTLLEHWAAAHIAAWPRTRPTGAVVDNIRTLFAVSAATARRSELPNHLIAAALMAAGHEGGHVRPV